MFIPSSKMQLIQRFSLLTPSTYHPQSIKRLEHLQGKAMREAAVLIGFVERPDGVHLVLTKRAAHLKHHPGQVSFPGGKYELTDDSLRSTALRETEEEIGILSSDIDIFGHMPSLPTVSQFSVTPYLAFIRPDYATKIDFNEVETVFEVPLTVIFDRQKFRSHLFCIKNQQHRVFGLTYQGHFIWGVTAQIIDAMRNHIMHQC